MEDIKKLANECLNCKKPMCKTGCPVLTSIPEFIDCIKNNNMEQAYRLVKSNNLMSEICSKICPVQEQCVGHCIKGIKGKPVQINKLEEFVNEWGRENNIKLDFEHKDFNNEKIAVVGGGPSGIACAIELRKLGYDVTIFEKEKKLGGILEYEIPDFRFQKTHIKNIEEKLKEIGINIKTNIEFGKKINIEYLKKKGYKAIFLGIGANVSNNFSLTENKCKSIYNGNSVLRKYHDGKKITNLGDTIVIGGGNVAMDVARTLKKAGNKSVTVIYRRTKELMPAIKEEQQECEKEGIKFVFNTKVVSVICDNRKRIEKIRCVKTKIEDNCVIDINGSEYEIKANSVVFAIGLGIDEEFLHNLGIKTQNGLVEIDHNNMTSVPRHICRRRFNRKKTNSM